MFIVRSLLYKNGFKIRFSKHCFTYTKILAVEQHKTHTHTTLHKCQQASQSQPSGSCSCVFLCTVSKRNGSVRCVGHQSLPHRKHRHTGTMVTNGSAFLLIAPSREKLLRPSWQRAQQRSTHHSAMCGSSSLHCGS